MHAGDGNGKSVSAGERKEERRRGVATYVVSVGLCVRGVVGVRGGRAAPAVGCRVGGRSGDDHVKGRVGGVLREDKNMRTEGRLA